MICRSIRMKLRSARGASITFALLLFLVCAVVGSVVLAAGTAASGRLSRKTEQDRRYYAVTSAAGLFRDALDGRSYTVTRTESVGQTSTTVYTYPATGEPTISGPVTVASGTTVYDATVSGDELAWQIGAVGKSLLADAAVQWLLGDEAERSAANAWDAAGGNSGSWSLRLNQDETAEGAVDTDMRVDVLVSMDENADILLSFTNTEGEPFTVTVKLNADVKQKQEGPTVLPDGKTSATTTDEEGTTVVESVEESVLTTTRTTTITWSVGEVKRVSG